MHRRGILYLQKRGITIHYSFITHSFFLFPTFHAAGKEICTANSVWLCDMTHSYPWFILFVLCLSSYQLHVAEQCEKSSVRISVFFPFHFFFPPFSVVGPACTGRGPLYRKQRGTTWHGSFCRDLSIHFPDVSAMWALLYTAIYRAFIPMTPFFSPFLSFSFFPPLYPLLSRSYRQREKRYVSGTAWRGCKPPSSSMLFSKNKISNETCLLMPKICFFYFQK